MNNIQTIHQSRPSTSQNRHLDMKNLDVSDLWTLYYVKLGFWLLALNMVVRILAKTRWFSNTIYFSAPLLIIGMLCLLYAAKRYVDKNRLPFKNEYIRIIYCLLCIWCIFTIFHGASFDYRTWRDMWGISLYSWTWVVPICMIFGADIKIWNSILQVIFQQGKTGIVVLVLGTALLSLFSPLGLIWGCPIALLFIHYLPKRWKKTILIGATISLFFSVLASARNQVLAHGIIMFFAAFINFYRKSHWQLRTRLIVITLCFALFGIIYYFSVVGQFSFTGLKIERSINRQITEFKEGLFDNSRGWGEEDSLYNEFFRDVNGFELLIGRGSMGTYAGRIGATILIPDYRRPNIECGYLQVMLKGGLIMLVLILALAIPAIYLGLFRTNNWFTRGAAFIVLDWLIEMVPYGLPDARLPYVIFWMAIGCCLSKSIRSIPESDILIPDAGVRYRIRF